MTLKEQARQVSHLDGGGLEVENQLLENFTNLNLLKLGSQFSKNGLQFANYEAFFHTLHCYIKKLP